MLTLDARTLLMVGFFSYALMGCLTLMAAVFAQRSRPLFWCASACLLGGISYLVGLRQGGHYWSVEAIWLSNIGLITVFGCLWTSFRVLAGKVPVWSGVCVGGIIWAGLCLWPVFMASVYFRIVVFSVLAIGYTVLCCRELMQNLRGDRWVILFLLAILVLHGVFYVVRLIPWSTSGTTWLARPDFAPTVFENILVIISLAYGVLIMVNSRTLHRYQDALQARRDLLGYISHDLRTPLVGMLDSARLWRAGDTRRNHLEVIERHASQQMDLIEELLEFSRSELADLELEPAPGYLHAFLDDLAEQASWTCERRGNQLERDFADTLPALVVVDFRRLRQVLSNLLGNATKFTRGGRIRFAVTTPGGRDDGEIDLHFMVRDNGIGIDTDERERLTLPFARGRGAGGHEGHGVGLAIVVRLLDLMGSRLYIDAAPDGGSCLHFSLTLPLADEASLEPYVEEGGMVDIDGGGRVVLVVDDDAQQRDLIVDLLNGYGFDAMVATGGAQALHVMHEHRVDVLTTDQMMPGMDGWSLLRHVRERHGPLPVLLYSSLPPRRPRGLDAEIDFDAVLLKPAGSAALLGCVMRLLDARGDSAARDGHAGAP